MSYIDQWKVEAEPKRISLHGPLAAAGRKRVFSLMAALVASDQSTSTTEGRQQTKVIAASQ